MAESVADLTLEILLAIRGELSTMNAKFDVLTSRVDRLEPDLGQLRDDMTSGFANLRGDVNAGFAAVRDEMNAGFAAVRDEMNVGFKALIQQGDRRYLDHEGRIRRIEDNLGLT